MKAHRESKTIEYFPYTHGDSLEMARQRINQERKEDFNAEQERFEKEERVRLGEQVFNEIYRGSPRSLANYDPIIYPQGDAK